MHRIPLAVLEELLAVQRDANEAEMAVGTLQGIAGADGGFLYQLLLWSRAEHLNAVLFLQPSWAFRRRPVFAAVPQGEIFSMLGGSCCMLTIARGNGRPMVEFSTAALCCCAVLAVESHPGGDPGDGGVRLALAHRRIPSSRCPPLVSSLACSASATGAMMLRWWYRNRPDGCL